MEQKLNNIEKYTKFHLNKSWTDLKENPNEYDNYNIEFWYNQYIQIETELEKIAKKYNIDYEKIHKDTTPSYDKYLYVLIEEIRSVI